MKINKQYMEFVVTDSEVDILEGTTQSGKTTTAVSTKFIYMVKETNRKKHLIAGESIGTIVSNILSTGEFGLLDNYKEITPYLNGNYKQKLPHLQIGDDIIFLVGYGDVSKFKKVLGGQFGAVYIDECNIANMQFINELFLPRFEYCCMTLNPDNPDKEIYNTIINRARPIDEHAEKVPAHIWEQLNRCVETKKWHYWFFTFDDNPSMTDEIKQRLYNSLLPDTREYKTKILGIRTKGVGLIFNGANNNIIPERCAMFENWEEQDASKLIKRTFKQFSCGVDTSYSSKTADTFSFIFSGITNDNKYIVLEEKVFNNIDFTNPLAVSDIAVKLNNFLDNCCGKWGIVKNVFIDSADTATMTEVLKHKRVYGSIYDFIPSYKQTKIIDRIQLQNSWLATKHYLIVENCKEHIKELNLYSWLPDKDIPEDKNDHTINASQYAFLPYKNIIGSGLKQ